MRRASSAPHFLALFSFAATTFACAAPAAEGDATDTSGAAQSESDAGGDAGACTPWTPPPSGRDPRAGRAWDPFDPVTCSSSFGPRRESLVSLAGSGSAPLRFCGSARILVRSRTCRSPSGCGPWGEPRPLEGHYWENDQFVTRPLDVHLGLAREGTSSRGPGIKLVVEDASVLTRSPERLRGMRFDWDSNRVEDPNVLIVGRDPYAYARVPVGNIVTTKLSLSDDCARLSGASSTPNFPEQGASTETEYAAVFRFASDAPSSGAP